jgi:quercetin dioxygenase-like cupin family protein
MIITRKYEEQKIAETAHRVDARGMYETDDAAISIVALQPGESLKRHITPVDVAFFVLDGKGTVEIGDEKQEVGKYTLVESPKDILHCWYNTGDELLRFMVIKAPKPTKKSIFLGA